MSTLTCWSCATEFPTADLRRATSAYSQPSAGDILVCGQCGSSSVLDSPTSARCMTEAEFHCLDEATRRDLDFAHRAITAKARQHPDNL